jgi:hypothetical protein
VLAAEAGGVHPEFELLVLDEAVVTRIFGIIAAGGVDSLKFQDMVARDGPVSKVDRSNKW